MANDAWIGITADLSQAESRVTDHIIWSLLPAGHPRKEFFRWRALVRPDEYDQHTARAAVIFDKEAAAVTKTERYLGKRTVHAYQRNMGPKTLWENILKDMSDVQGFVVPTVAQCQKLLDKLDVAEPEIKGVYFQWVKDQLVTTRTLVNSWGRRVHYQYERFNDALYRKGYSFYPQSEVAGFMAARVLSKFSRFYKLAQPFVEAGELKKNAEVHDSLFMSAWPEIAYDATFALVNSLEKPRVMYGGELVIPCEITIGKTWKGSKEWKRLPSREEFDEGVREVLAA